MDEEIKKILEDHEKRIKSLESLLPKEKQQASKCYKGLAGGIRYLIDHGFLGQHKTVNEIMVELKREGYHHSVASVSKMLSVNFIKNNKDLNRIKEDGVWKYVLRK